MARVRQGRPRRVKCIAPRCAAPRERGALFCRPHLAAPSGSRGGWISAFRRAQKRGAGAPIDASPIARRLWVGGKPPFDRDLPDFDVLFLCAEEIQPMMLAFGREVVRVPLRDDMLSPQEIKRALIGGRQVAEALRRGKRVLVTCRAGLNRSALVAGLGLGLATRMPASRIVDTIRERRAPAALHNPHFVEIIHQAIGNSSPRPSAR